MIRWETSQHPGLRAYTKTEMREIEFAAGKIIRIDTFAYVPQLVVVGGRSRGGFLAVCRNPISCTAVLVAPPAATRARMVSARHGLTGHGVRWWLQREIDHNKAKATPERHLKNTRSAGLHRGSGTII